MTDTLSTGRADVEASILADSAAGLSIPKIAARCGWGRQAVAGVLALAHNLITGPIELAEVTA